MNAEIVLNSQVVVDVDGFVAKGTDIYFFVFLVVFTAAVRLDGRMVSTIDFIAVLTLDRKPILLTASVESAEFTNILVKHFEYFLRL